MSRTHAELTDEEKRIRLFIYDFFVRSDRSPTINEIAEEARLTPVDAHELLGRLETEHSAIVLSPGSPNIWLADPFAALPTAYPVFAGDHRWFGMCIWDALAILSLSSDDGYAPTMCPVSGEELTLRVANGELTEAPGVVHFAVSASDWWRDIGFT